MLEAGSPPGASIVAAFTTGKAGGRELAGVVVFVAGDTRVAFGLEGDLARCGKCEGAVTFDAGRLDVGSVEGPMSDRVIEGTDSRPGIGGVTRCAGKPGGDRQLVGIAMALRAISRIEMELAIDGPCGGPRGGPVALLTGNSGVSAGEGEASGLVALASKGGRGEASVLVTILAGAERG